jgi:hypothetical protein
VYEVNTQRDKDFISSAHARTNWSFSHWCLQQKEIDTHLNVLHVTVNSNYASFTDTAGALNRMSTIYGNGRTLWHFPNADLHHGLLGKKLGGGTAFVGALCSPNLGFGLSAGLHGKFTQMSSAVVWDFSVVSFESNCYTIYWSDIHA